MINLVKWIIGTLVDGHTPGQLVTLASAEVGWAIVVGAGALAVLRRLSHAGHTPAHRAPAATPNTSDTHAGATLTSPLYRDLPTESEQDREHRERMAAAHAELATTRAFMSDFDDALDAELDGFREALAEVERIVDGWHEEHGEHCTVCRKPNGRPHAADVPTGEYRRIDTTWLDEQRVRREHAYARRARGVAAVA